MDLVKEKNTALFYEELEKESCDVELLYNLSLDGIRLYRPLYRYKKIRHHDYVVDISLMNKQYFKIYNDSQFKRLIQAFKKLEEEGKDKDKYIRLILLNEYIINKIVNDNNYFNVFKYSYELSNIPLYYLFKYKYISYKILDYFKYDRMPYYLIIYIVFINAFYFKENINLMNINKYLGKYYFSSQLKYEFERDIKALEYIIINVRNYIKDDYCYRDFRTGPFYPFNLLKKVSSKIFKPNILYFKHPDKNIEDLFNSICGDSILCLLHSEDSICRVERRFSDMFSRYDIPYDVNNFTIVNFDEYKLKRNKIEEDRLKNCYIKENELWFGNKDLFNINFELKKQYLEYDNRENDPTIDNNYFYTIIIRCCVIGSLIYNKKSKFIISILTELLKKYVPLTYNPQENILRFDPIRKCMDDYDDGYEEWVEDYDEIFYRTLVTTSNENFNKLFRINYGINIDSI
ncbi:hypothetical protein BCR32DRAFT_275952 [Anaeromyces robustus]|uniref:Uncharacterized protein n=1 Tax=Anaeromyces robustus TaxID=1754192 RepID=A0A1Y1XK85_9FUNG|nr:hypothetical protein BCR32DRAFT_275952 [Anaeromyces robustus]|eukprot:ORX85866.1 hypothetical protein BCR32DRAFT_275952 [Anaeromyces robustus]